MHLYVKSYKLPSPATSKRPVYVQRLVSMKHAQWVEYDAQHHIMRIKMPDSFVADEYTLDKNEDPSILKRVFYDLVKDARQEGKVVEW